MSIIDQTIQSERQSAIRDLLMHPLISAYGYRKERFNLIRKHSDWLCRWFLHQTGWTLHVENDCARLFKTPIDASDNTRALIDHHSKTPFTRKRYVVLCLVLALLEKAGRQTALGKLAEDLESSFKNDEMLTQSGMEFSMLKQTSRSDLVAVARFLKRLGIIERIAGDEKLYLNSNDIKDHTKDVLYNIHRSVLSRMLSVYRGPSMLSGKTQAERIKGLHQRPLVEGDESRKQAIRQKLARRLLDEPVVYYRDLNDEEKNYLATQRPHLLGRLCEMTGLVAEVRAEGIALVDERGDLSDIHMPEDGTDGHVALLIAEKCLEHQKHNEGNAIPMVDLEMDMRALIREHGSRWRKSASDPGSAKTLLKHALERLRALKLIDYQDQTSVIALPALHRYQLHEVIETPPQTPSQPMNLFEIMP